MWEYHTRINDVLLKDDHTYLVCWYEKSENKYSRPHMAYWLAEEKQFFSLENQNAHPIIVDIWMKVPELPPSR